MDELMETYLELTLVLNGHNSAPRVTSGLDRVLVGNRQQVAFVVRQLLVHLFNAFLLVI